MGLHLSTINGHLYDARIKLGASNSAHTVARAIETEQIPAYNLSMDQIARLEREAEKLGMDIFAIGMLDDLQPGEDYYEILSVIIQSLKSQCSQKKQ